MKIRVNVMINVSKRGNTENFSKAQFNTLQTIMLKGLLGGAYHELKTLKTINMVH